MGTTCRNASVALTIKMLCHDASEKSLKDHIKKTIAALQRHNKCYKTDEEKIAIRYLTKTFLVAHEYLSKNKKEIFVQDEDGIWVIEAKEMCGDLYQATGVYHLHLLLKSKVGCSVLKSKGIGERGLEQLIEESECCDELESSEDEDAEKAVVKKYVKVLRTTQDNLNFTKQHPEFQHIVADIMMNSKSHHCYPDHIAQNFHETVDFVFEMFLGCSLDGCSPVLVMERYLCLGSESVRKYIRLPCEDDDVNKDPIKLLDGTENARVAQTWEPYLSALRHFIRTMNLDPRTRTAVEAMIRTQLKDGYLQWHYGCRIWGYFENVSYEGPFDSLEDPIFPQVKEVAIEIVGVVQNQDLSDEQKKGQIDEALKSICSGLWKSNDVGYTQPDEKFLCTAGATMILQVIKDAVASLHEKEVIVVEKCLIHSKKFDKSTRDHILDGEMLEIHTVTGEEAGELWETRHGEQEGKTILIFVICSNHVLYGWNSKMKDRLHNGSYAITYMAILEDAGLIPEGTTEREYKIMLSFFIGTEGLFGNILTDDDMEGGFFFNVKKALPIGYFINCYRPGTHALASRVSTDLHPLHIVSLMVVMGFQNFSAFFKLHTGIMVPEDSTFADFLLEVKTAKRKEGVRERVSLFTELRKIARIPEQQRSAVQMARADEILMTYSGSYLLQDICKCDRIVSEYQEDSDWSGLYQRLQGVVSRNRLKQYMINLGIVDSSTADRIISGHLIGQLASNLSFHDDDDDVVNSFFDD